MKVPFISAQSHQSSNNKLQNSSARNTSFNSSTADTNNLCYEPKSVLDLRRSQSPISSVAVADEKVPKSGFSDALLQSEDGSVQWEDDQILNNFEEWDSLMRELGLHDDSCAPALKSIVPQFNHSETQFPVLLPDFPLSHSFDSTHTHFGLSEVSSNQNLNQNFNSFDLCSDFHHMNHWNNDGFNFVDELIRAADCFESNELQLAHGILARLNQKLRSPAGKPLERVAFYFKEALQTMLTGSTRPTRPSDSSEVVQAIKAHKNFSNVSPIVMFSNFTANQAILEALDGSKFIHVVDFDIGFGGQWASFMKEVADSAESRKSNAPVLRITAIVPEEYAVESRLVRDNLNHFASELKIVFEIDFVSIRTFEILSFKAIKSMEGEKTAVVLSPIIFQRMGVKFLNDLRQISPHVVVIVDGEGLTYGGGAPSFRRSVIEGLEFYSTVLESVEAASVGGGGEDWIRRIEMFMMRPKIFAAVEAAGRRAPPWREAFAAAGLRAVGLSQFADFQADCLLRKAQLRGFHVAKQQAEMVLCWQDRPLVATSAWRC
ncbi:hypothetical protein ACSBR2_010063 [Camellia fascicularis]